MLLTRMVICLPPKLGVGNFTMLLKKFLFDPNKRKRRTLEDILFIKISSLMNLHQEIPKTSFYEKQ